MIDELDLAFDERAEKGRHRRGARRKSQKKGRGGRTAVALIMAFVLLGALGGGLWYGFDKVQALLVTPDYDGGGHGQVSVEVKRGDTITDMANTLVGADVVKSAKAFIEAAEENSLSQNIQPGVYTLRLQMSAADAVALLVDPKNRNTNGLTIPEGLSSLQVFKKLSEATKIPVDDFKTAAKDPIALGVPDWWFTRSDGKKVTPTIEGFLFPDTYEMDPKPTADKILRMMVDRFLTVTGDLNFADFVQANRGGITPYEALMVASLAQAEAGNPDDLGKVARVAYNRVYIEKMPLQFDVTINYGLELAGKPTKSSKDMSAEFQDESNPYNMHIRTGLPPTPINNPGKAALEGAMDPPAGKWLFFVAIDKQGHSAFAETDAQHEENKRKAREAGIIN